MLGDVVTQASVCSTHGCQQVTILHVAGGEMSASVVLGNTSSPVVSAEDKTHPLSVDTSNQCAPLSVTTERKSSEGIAVTAGLMCRTSQGEWEFLLVDEGVIVLLDNQCVLVKRKVYKNITEKLWRTT